MIILNILVVCFYIVLGLIVGKKLFFGRSIQKNLKPLYFGIGVFIIFLHAFILYRNVFTESDIGLNFGFYNAFSLLMWMVCSIIIITSTKRPIENLGIFLFPVAALAVVLNLIYPTAHIILPNIAQELRLHIVISFLAYSLLSVAAIQAVLLAIQNKYLRNKHPGGFIRTLPPLETMETLLFQLIGTGFILQSLSLFTGILYLEDIFKQHLVHKTVLSIVAWFIFAILLWGRWKFGWRGRTAIRWTLSGFFLLLLSYLGSKMVQEIVLGR